MKAVYFIMFLAVSAFLFVTVSTAQQDKTTKKKTTTKTETTTVEETGNADRSNQSDVDVQGDQHQTKTKSKSRTHRTDTSGIREETGSRSRSMQDDKTVQQDRSTTGNRTGKVIFETNKCNTCHEIKSENIKKTGTSKAPDLSSLSVDRDAPWIQKFLKKDETLNGKKHPISFKGDSTELKTLATWLASHTEEKK